MNILDFLKYNIFCLDGGMGTLLQEKGLMPGEYPEFWNLTHADVIRQIHRDYFDAGSNIININTFGANPLKFSDSELEKIICAAADNAKYAREESYSQKEKYIALDIGPCGKLLKPYGDFEFEEAVAAFGKTVEIGCKCGVDLIFIETMNDSLETKAALLAAKEYGNLPVFVSNAYSENGKLMTGASPEAMVALLEGMRADAIGVNCSFGPDQTRPVVERLLKCASVPVILKPNAGLPKSVDGKTVYDVSVSEFTESVLEMIRMGVRVAGGCCGTTPEYIKAVSDGIANMQPVPLTNKNLSCISSYSNAVYFGGSPILIGERINPTGKKRFRQALMENDTDYILHEGIAQQEHGVQVLDVNVGISEIDETEVVKNTVYELQGVTDLPLQLDTSNPKAMEKAMRIYNGKAMINSVNGKEESMHAIFPFVQKYGGFVVALTLDEKGIPETAEGRFEIAKKILKTAAEYGIDKKDIIFDTLAMTISADKDAASATLTALKMIREQLGCNTSLGVSNISFGLPSRDAVNSTFFAVALTNGLSAAIMNPYSSEMMKTYHAYRALFGYDPNCGEYIEYMANHVETVQTAKPAAVSKNPESYKSALQKAIIKGLKDEAGKLTSELLAEIPPLEIVEKEIIPSLDIVGKGYEENRVYLPQLLMSADAARSSFESIKNHMATQKSSLTQKCVIVIATVHGDIHDIGKNIVRLLLENYGFCVTDLGRDVPPEDVLEAVVRLHSPLAGLSALMTTTVPAMEETIKLLNEKAPWCKVIVGGAVLTQEYADSIGADKYAKDAMESVRYAEYINSQLS